MLLQYVTLPLCRMIKEEGHNLEDAIIKCKDMTETLLSLRKYVILLYNVLVRWCSYIG